MSSFFLFPALLSGLALVALPVIIHLINLMRHRRVRWAAMEFLLESQKKNSAYVMLKQLLLLLMRMAAIAAVVLILAQPFLRDNWQWLAGNETHHVVILDNSFSMGDRGSDMQTAFDRAKTSVAGIGQAASNERTAQKFTLWLTSDSRRPEMREELVNQEFNQLLTGTLEDLEPSQLDRGPSDILARVRELLEQEENRNRAIYVVSDFRLREWGENSDLIESLKALDTAGAQLVLVNCVSEPRPNVAVTSLRPVTRSRAAGVPMLMEVDVKNFGQRAARDITVSIVEDGVAGPNVQFDQIEPGKVESRRFQVHFQTAGDHRITARLEEDAVSADNFRHVVLDFPVAIPVLLIDGDPAAGDARALANALDPGGNVKTGVAPQIEPPGFLNSNELNQYRVIYLLNVDRLEDASVTALEEFVANGGGLGIFAGPNTNSAFYTDRLYQDGKGLFPVPLDGAAELLVDRLVTGADLQVAEHPIFRIFLGERNSFINEVKIWDYLAVPASWQPDPDTSTARVIARLRNNAPLVIESTYGEGRVLTYLTTAGRAWNNWLTDPSYVVAMLETQSHLSTGQGRDESRPVGSKLELKLDPSIYNNEARVLTPDADETMIAAAIQEDGLLLSIPDTDLAGVYEVQLGRIDGKSEKRMFALNVDAEEGDLKIASVSELDDRLVDIDYDLQQAENMQLDLQDEAGTNLSTWILYALVFLLIGEQMLAYLLSFHPKGKEGAA